MHTLMFPILREHSIREGSLVLHFKYTSGDMTPFLYKVLNFGTNTETNERVVVYQNISTSKIYVRPYEMFMSEVDSVKYPKTTFPYRFNVIRY